MDHILHCKPCSQAHHAEWSYHGVVRYDCDCRLPRLVDAVDALGFLNASQAHELSVPVETEIEDLTPAGTERLRLKLRAQDGFSIYTSRLTSIHKSQQLADIFRFNWLSTSPTLLFTTHQPDRNESKTPFERHPQHDDTRKPNLQTFANMNARALYLWSLALLAKNTIGVCSQHQPGTCSAELTASLGPAGGQNYVCTVLDHACNEIGNSGNTCDPGQSINSQLAYMIDIVDRGGLDCSSACLGFNYAGVRYSGGNGLNHCDGCSSGLGACSEKYFEFSCPAH